MMFPASTVQIFHAFYSENLYYNKVSRVKVYFLHLNNGENFSNTIHFLEPR
jgi:hypothetical protein